MDGIDRHRVKWTDEHTEILGNMKKKKQTDKQMDEKTSRQTDRLTDGWMEKYTDRQLDRQINWQTYGKMEEDQQTNR